jgi:hypothetical protein
MKTFHFNIQAKGGAGKSMLTYLQALKNENNDKVAFVELDSTTKTSKRQLKFLAEKNRLFEIEIFDKIKQIERQQLIEVLEDLNSYDFTDIYMDFGATESEQFINLINIDFNIDEFKSFETELDAKFVFNVVIAGGTSFASTFEYLKTLADIVNGHFDIIAYANEFTFQHYEQQLTHLQSIVENAKGDIKALVPFGAIHTDRSGGHIIITNVKDGKGLAAYTSFSARIIIKREMAKI